MGPLVVSFPERASLPSESADQGTDGVSLLCHLWTSGSESGCR